LRNEIFWKFTHPFIGLALPLCVIRGERLLWDNEGICSLAVRVICEFFSFKRYSVNCELLFVS